MHGREFALQDAVPFGLQHGADSGRAEILAKEWIVSAWAAWRRYDGRTDSCVHLFQDLAVQRPIRHVRL